MGRVGLGDEAAGVEHQRVVGAGGVGLDLRQDRLDQVRVVDLRVHDVRGRATDAAGDEAQAALVVDRGLELREDDERRPRLVQSRVHARGDLGAAGQGQADVDAVGHSVRGQRPPDLLDDLVVGRDLDEGQRLGGAVKAIEMLAQPEDAAVVKPQTFPYGIATLDHGIERADPGLVAVDQLPVDVDLQVTVSFVESLQHPSLRRPIVTVPGSAALTCCAQGGSDEHSRDEVTGGGDSCDRRGWRGQNDDHSSSARFLPAPVPLPVHGHQRRVEQRRASQRPPGDVAPQASRGA